MQVGDAFAGVHHGQTRPAIIGSLKSGLLDLRLYSSSFRLFSIAPHVVLALRSDKLIFTLSYHVKQREREIEKNSHEAMYNTTGKKI